MTSDYLQLAQRLRDQACRNNQRRTLVLSGDASWCYQLAAAICEQLSGLSQCWVGEAVPDGVESITNQQVRGVLGGECSLLVYDAHDTLDADAFAAAAGAICGGGVLLLLTPCFSAWAERGGDNKSAGHFIQYFIRQLRGAEGVLLAAQGDVLPPLPPEPAQAAQPVAEHPYLTNDQQRAVQAIHRLLQGHRRRPLVITADRGRGKSGALGLAAAQLLQQGVKRILVTAPSREAARAVFEQAAMLLMVEVTDNRLSWQGGVLQFVSPDQLLASREKADLLLVDEAAAIPVAILQRLLARYSRIVFASTIHGYEGSGHGFAIRFQKHLDKVAAGWWKLHLKQPIRWSENDPLEALLSRALCLNAELESVDAVVSHLTPEQCSIGQVAPQVLLENSALLNSLFGLLVNAHYRTSPSDLKKLLDDPDLTLYLMQAPPESGGQVVGVLLLADEGGFSLEMAQQIQQGRRRPRGHLMAQSLTAQLGLLSGAQLNCARIMRIAIHPQLQRRGFGSYLLSAVKRASQACKRDLLGASFGATPELLHFWQSEGLEPVFLGVGCESSSGAHAALMLQPLSDAGERLFQSARQRGRQLLLAQLAEPLATLEAEVALLLLQQQQALPLPLLDNQDKSDLYHFAHHQRGYELTLHALRPLACWGLVNCQPALSHADAVLLLCRVLQQRPMAQCIALTGLTGRKQLISALRQAVKSVLSQLRGRSKERGSEYEKPSIQ
ncbi:MAG: GNAT family N-acetyltransferase [Gammaproteobacteria bacterium]|nr:GNAT family N-acetyltransferase [Gammaproteobacteria bacterium]MCF6231346.1 GNAT family N-acetyltransferase [Gammaproteobacteria bacterium]